MHRRGAHLFVAVCLWLYLSSVRAIEVCVGTLPNFQHDIEGDLCIIDQNTMVIRGFGYDGGGPEAYLYYYTPEDGYTARNVPRDGRGGTIPHPQTRGRLPRFRVSGSDLQFTLPDGVRACDIAVFTIWCDLANTHFTAIDIPEDTFTTNMTDDSKVFCTRGDGGDGGDGGFDNCKQLHDSVTLSWTADRDSENVEFMLCGCRSTDTDQANTWLGFGLSGSTERTLMFGADASIVWVDDEQGPQAVDYHLSAYTQCRGGEGACPDTEDSSGTCTDDVTPVGGISVDGQQCVTFTRNFAAGDECDLPLDPDNEDQYVVWGVGGLGETAFRHFIRAQGGDPPLHLGRAPSSDCQPLVCSACDPYQNQRLAAPSNTTFIAHIGPSGDQRGYMGITGRAGWGITWYINGTLIPELVVQRGQTYTFIVYGGDDEGNSAQYHPFYITDSVNGGRLLNTVEQRADEVVYAGFQDETPIGVGPLCEYRSNVVAEDIADNCNSLLCHYEAALTPPDCTASDGTNSFTWTPDESTPDVVYYQCATHQNLGWVIQVTDSVLQYLDANSGSDMPTSPPTCPILGTTEPPTVTDPVVTDPVVTDPMATDPMVTDPMMTDPVMTDLVDGSSSTLHASLPLFISLILVNTLALLFI